MRNFLALIAVLSLGACMSRSQSTTRANRENEQKIQSALTLGMTKAEVQAAAGATPVANCRGNPNGLETCQMNLWVDSSGAPWPFVTDYTKNKYSQYELTFQDGKLTRWNQKEESGYQVTQPQGKDSAVEGKDLLGEIPGK